MRSRRQIFLFFCGAVFLLSIESLSGAVGPENVLVLYNKDSAEGIELANYYAAVHPGVHLLGLNDITAAEDVTADYYLNMIRPQILPALDPSITTIVTTKGLPLRICTEEEKPQYAPTYNYRDPFGVTREIGIGSSPPYCGWWRPYSSLESELTRIDVIGTWEQMGDQTYFNAPNASQGDPNLPHHANNPYYLPAFSTATFQYEARSAPFDCNQCNVPGFGGMRLTSRLDGFTVADVKASIDRAQQAYLPPGPASPYIVVDDSPNAVGGDRMSNLKTVLDRQSQAYLYNNDGNAITSADRPVIGYVSHGTNDGAGGLEEGYLDPNVGGHLDFTLANGAVFFTHESDNASTFRSPEGQKQGLAAEWIALGGTVGVGNVWEPESGRTTEANEDQIFKMLLDGYTWGEAAWSSMKELSYVNTVVGDPLMTWKRPAAGTTTYTEPLKIGDKEDAEYVIREGGTVVTTNVQIGGSPDHAGTLDLEGGTLRCTTLTIGANGVMNYTGGTLDVDTVTVQGSGALNASSLTAGTLIIGSGTESAGNDGEEPPDIPQPIHRGGSIDETAVISYTGTTTIQGEYLLIDTPGLVSLNQIEGDGELFVGNQSSSTTLTASSIVVGSLIIGGAAAPPAPLGSASNTAVSSPVPEPNCFVLLGLGVLGGLLFRRRGRGAAN
jgi:hypothetical protein